ncbi:MAG: type IV toxin-antitoxin system AbiEi family antitoxin domain-containing protein, partial [Acidimicrobiales bacterium]
MEALGARASTQHGLVSWRHALDLGVPSTTVARWARQRRLVRVHTGVYRMAGAPVTWEQSVLAAVLAAGDGAVASHRSAARLWGLHDNDAVEITVPYAKLPRLRGVVVHRSRDLAPRWTSRRRAVLVTTPARTLVDLGAVLARRLVEDALDRALAARLLTVAAVEHALDELGGSGRQGAGVIRTILDRRALGAERPDGLLEARMARL